MFEVSTFDESYVPCNVRKEFTSAGSVFDSTERSIDLENIQDVEENYQTMYGIHSNKQAWFGVITYNGAKWVECITQAGKVIGLYTADTPDELFIGVLGIHDANR